MKMIDFIKKGITSLIHLSWNVEYTPEVDFGKDVTVWAFGNLFGGCKIGDGTSIGAHCTIGRNVKIGMNCKIQDFVCLNDGHIIGDEVFIGALVTFCNDKFPSCLNADGTRKGDGDWTCEPVTVEDGASIGSGAIIGPGVTIGKGAQVAMGAIVFADVPAGATAIGNPARCITASVGRLQDAKGAKQ